MKGADGGNRREVVIPMQEDDLIFNSNLSNTAVNRDLAP